jgi:hypothetical protein
LTAEIGAEALIQAALVGNLELVQKNAQQLIDFQIAEDSNDMKLFEQRINLEKMRIDTLSGRDKQVADARIAVAELMLTDKQNKLENAREDKKELIDFATIYLEKTGDGAGAAKILNGTLSEALAKYGNAIKETPKAEKESLITSGSARFTREQIQQVSATIQASKEWANKDGYVNTDLYFQELQNWVADGGLESDYVKFFPPHWLRPDSPNIPDWFRNKYMKEKTSVEDQDWN